MLPEEYLDHRAALRERLTAYKQSKGDSGNSIPEVLASATEATTADACPECNADTGYGWDGEVCGGHTGCGYVHRSLYKKPAYSHLTTAFKRGVRCIDEVAEIRGDDSLRSKALRGMARGPFIAWCPGGVATQRTSA